MNGRPLRGVNAALAAKLERDAGKDAAGEKDKKGKKKKKSDTDGDSDDGEEGGAGLLVDDRFSAMVRGCDPFITCVCITRYSHSPIVCVH